VQAARGLVDAAVLGHGQQDAQLLQLHRGAVFSKKGRENAVLVVLPMASEASFCRGFRLVIGMKICDSSLLRFA
jgi:hypothetical protein